MSTVRNNVAIADQTPVDDVRRVREKLNREMSNDVQRLAEHARRLTDQRREELGLRRVASPPAVVSPEAIAEAEQGCGLHG